MTAIKLPSLRSLQAFEAVGRCGSITEAALALEVSPGAVSQQVHALEQAVGVPLFERLGRSLELTTWGKMYFERIGVGFDHLRSAHEVLQRARQVPGLVLSALPSLTIRWLRPLMSEWQMLHPGSVVRLIGEDDNPDLDEAQVDFRIFYGQPQLHYRHFANLFFDWVVPVCSPAFAANHPVNSAAGLIKCPLIGIEWDVRHRPPPSWADWAASRGVAPPDRPCELTFSLSSAAIDAAVNDGGVVLGQVAMVIEDVRKGKLVIPVEHRLRLPEPYVLAWNPAALDRPLGNDFRSFIHRAARRQGATVMHSEPAPAKLLD